jgi:hypothetical protein
MAMRNVTIGTVAQGLHGKEKASPNGEAFDFQLGLVPMLLAVSATRVLSMLARLRGVSKGGMSVVRGLLVTTTLVLFCSLLVVLRSVRVVFRCFSMVVSRFL